MRIRERKQKDMKYAVIYESATGNTEMLAKEIKSTLGEEKCVCFGTPEEELQSKAEDADLIFLGFWTDKGECSEKIRKYMETLHNRNVFLFGTAGFGGSEQYFTQILNRVSAHLPEGNKVSGTYMCQGKMPQSVRKRYEAMQEKAPQDEKIKMMIENFDRAASHPDKTDLARLEKAVADLISE